LDWGGRGGKTVSRKRGWAAPVENSNLAAGGQGRDWEEITPKRKNKLLEVLLEGFSGAVTA